MTAFHDIKQPLSNFRSWNVKNYISCGPRLSQVPYIGKMQLKSIQNILSSFNIKMQDNVMQMGEIAVSLFQILWMPIQLLQQMVDRQHRTRWWGCRNIHWLIDTLTFATLCSAIVFCLFSYNGCIIHIATNFQLCWLDYRFPWNCLIWHVLVTVTYI